MLNTTGSASAFDAAFYDREDRMILVMDVKARTEHEPWDAILRSRLSQLPPGVEFALAVDPRSMDLFRVVNGNVESPILTFDTKSILCDYDNRFAERRTFEPYIVTLVEAWLRDLAYHWKNERPPGAEALREVGVLAKLEEGTTKRLGD